MYACILYSRQRYAEEQCSFRTEFVYNNGMYTLASEVIAAIASRPYGNLVIKYSRHKSAYRQTV